MRGAVILALLFPVLAEAAARKPVASRRENQPLTIAPDDHAFKRVLDEASCSGEYADAMLVLPAEAREFERRPESNYSYCLRNTAVYECLSYASDGKVKKKPISVVAHGAGFSYWGKNGDYFLLTNDHVASWPMVTDEDHEVDGVPAGCKKVDEELRIVKDENDDYVPGQIPVQKVVSDPILDAAVLKTRSQLNVMPYRVGRSALLKAGNVVQIRGYPLGLMQATNSGKIVNATDVDREKIWHHTDFVVDALVTKGNSGSPVFAVSCRTGALELVGLYHAGYKGSPALNVAVGIDQLHDLMDNFRKSKPPAEDGHNPLGPDDRKTLVEALQNPESTPYFRVGDRMARARLQADGHIVYDIFNDAFPAKDLVSISLEEAPNEKGGALQLFSVMGDSTPTRRAAPAELDAEAQRVAGDLYSLVQRQFLLTLKYRLAAKSAGHSRESFRHANDLARKLDGDKGEAADLMKSVGEIASRMPIVVGPVGSNPSELTRNIADMATKVAPPDVPPEPTAVPASSPPVQPQP